MEISHCSRREDNSWDSFPTNPEMQYSQWKISEFSRHFFGGIQNVPISGPSHDCIWSVRKSVELRRISHGVDASTANFGQNAAVNGQQYRISTWKVELPFNLKKRSAALMDIPLWLDHKLLSIPVHILEVNQSGKLNVILTWIPVGICETFRSKWSLFQWPRIEFKPSLQRQQTKNLCIRQEFLLQTWKHRFQTSFHFHHHFNDINSNIRLVWGKYDPF